MRRLTNEEFIKSCIEKHGDKYVYTKINYIKGTEDVIVICKEHGEFNIKASNFKKGFGCRKCSILRNKELQSSNNYIENFKKKHGNKYDYSLVEYINNKTKIKIICEEHGIFEQRPDMHLRGNGCPKCSIKYKLTTDEFIKHCKEKHGDKYDYSLVKYINNKTKIKIICNEHGIFKQTPKVHISSNGCPKCSVNRRLTNKIFIKESKKFHRDKYDYSKVDIVNSHTKVTIICKKHGEFKQKPYKHMQKRGCPICNNSKGVKKICNYLDDNDISYELEKSIDGCVSKKGNLLYFDIYIPEKDIYVEYDGKQHFRPVENWGGEKALSIIKDRDYRKDKFCLDNSMNLYRISYYEDIIYELEEILDYE